MSPCLEDLLSSLQPNISNVETQGVNLPMRSNTKAHCGVLAVLDSFVFSIEVCWDEAISFTFLDEIRRGSDKVNHNTNLGVSTWYSYLHNCIWDFVSQCIFSLVTSSLNSPNFGAFKKYPDFSNIMKTFWSNFHFILQTWVLPFEGSEAIDETCATRTVIFSFKFWNVMWLSSFLDGWTCWVHSSRCGCPFFWCLFEM